MSSIQYYCVGFMWKRAGEANQLDRFLYSGIWENGYADKHIDRVISVPIGSRLAAKKTYTRKEDNETISILSSLE